MDFDKADMRISARRNRIKNRISAARKIRKMIQIKHMFGYHSTENRETFPVEAQCDASRALIENVIDNGSELVTNIRLAADHLQVNLKYVHWWTYIFVRQDLSKMFELFQLTFQQISETNDTSFESPNIELLELRKKLGVASP